MMLNPAAFNAWVGGRIGQKVKWKRGNPCPCFNPQSGAALPGHPLCGGKGWIWDAAIDDKVGVSQQKAQREWAQSGQWEAGDVIVTIQQNAVMYDQLGRFDRIELSNSTDVFKFMLTRGINDRIYTTVTSFTRVFWLNPANINQIITGGLPVADVNGNLSWPNNDGPPNGTQYSIEGTRPLDYFVFVAQVSNRAMQFGSPLPQKAWLRRFDLFSR